MNAWKKLNQTAYIAWVIGTKDILDVVKNKSTATNLLMMLGIVVFFYYLGVWRPFDKEVSVIFYDEGSSDRIPESITLKRGAEYTFQKAASKSELEEKLSHQDYNQDYGLVIPADFDQSLDSGLQPTLTGILLWPRRYKVAELEATYTQDLTELFGKPVNVFIDKNILIPSSNGNGMQVNLSTQVLYFLLWSIIILVPTLMLEERKTKTLDALAVSPASTEQIILGKAVAGLFYALVIGGLAIALDYLFITNWLMLLLAFTLSALFCIGLALVLGSFVQSPQQLSLLALVIMIILLVPSYFAMEPILKAGIRAFIAWLPSVALSGLFRYSFSTPPAPAQFWQNLLIAVVYIGAVFGLIIWKVRRSDR